MKRLTLIRRFQSERLAIPLFDESSFYLMQLFNGVAEGKWQVIHASAFKEDAQILIEHSAGLLDVEAILRLAVHKNITIHARFLWKKLKT